MKDILGYILLGITAVFFAHLLGVVAVAIEYYGWRGAGG